MHTLLQDIRFALRQLRKSLGFTTMAVVTLALGIGATTAVFSLVDTVLLHPLPFYQPGRIVAIDSIRNSFGSATFCCETSYPNFADWRERVRSFESIASWQGNSLTLGASNAPASRIDGLVVSSDFFRVLRIQPQLGRNFTRDEEHAGNRSVIVSHALWQTALNASPNAIGQTIHLSDESYTVIGVLPASFQFPNAPDAQVWITPSQVMEGKNPAGQQRGWNQISVIARLRDGVSVAQAYAEMQPIQHALAVQYPEENKDATAANVTPELQNLVGDVQQPLRILFAAVSLLLLIACANVAGLLLTRTASRRSELALRTALGASRFEIVRQLLIESLTLSLLGGIAGAVLAAIALKLAPQFLPTDLPRISELALNGRVLLFSLGASLLTGLLFGVLPAWRSSRLDPAMALRETSRSNTAGGRQNRLHSALVIGETALGLILLVGAGLLIRSFDKTLSVDPGFNATHLLTFRIGMPPRRFQDQKLLQLVQQLQSTFAALPGVQQSTAAQPLPLAGGDMTISFTIDGRPHPLGEDPAERASLVTANFFHALQIPLLRGRFFGPTEDRYGTPPVIIIIQAFAARYFPGEDALGKHITSGLSEADTPVSREVVGIVANVHRKSLTEEPKPEYYISFAQVPFGPPSFALRTAGDPAAMEQTVRSAVAHIDPTLPVYQVRTNLLARSTAQQRFQTILISSFAVIALLLAAIGLYAVLSYMVVQRNLELGLRMALGAQRSDVLTLILKRGLTLCATGLAIGLVASALIARSLTTLLFHTQAFDVVTFSSTTLLLLVISTVACLIPAWRASRLDPNETLHQQ